MARKKTPAKILIGRGQKPKSIDPAFANRHGLVAGATGTGKTVTLQVMAEAFSQHGIPVFCADVKGDLSGLSQAGKPSAKLNKRAAELGAKGYVNEASPVVFWDIFGEQGHPIRTTIAEMGPLMLARLLELNEVQEGVLNVAFQVAEDEGLLLLDLSDLRALLTFIAEHAKDLSLSYGRVSTASVGAIQRRLLTLKQQGAENFFGEPALQLQDLMQVDADGRGTINVLMANQLMQAPRVYSTVLLWLLSELFEELPEVGDPDKPKLVFFFDEAHLLFDDAPTALLDKVEQVVRLIRSKGVGVYFVTQNPMDVPEDVLGQLGNRVQHALRAFTPQQKKAVSAAADTFRPNPAFKTRTAITQLGVGEALISTLEKNGIPSIVDRAKILPPRSRMGPITERERNASVASSPLADRYDEPLDRESAYEKLQQKAERASTDQAEEQLNAAIQRREGFRRKRYNSARRIGGGRRPAKRERTRRGGNSLMDMFMGNGRRQGVGEAMAKSMARSVGSQVGRALTRGVFGSLLKSR